MKWNEINQENVLDKMSVLLNSLGSDGLTTEDENFLDIVLFGVNEDYELVISNENKLAMIIANAWMKFDAKRNLSKLAKDLDKILEIKVVDGGTESDKRTGKIEDTGHRTNKGSDNTEDIHYIGNKSETDPDKIDAKFIDTKDTSKITMGTGYDNGNTREFKDYKKETTFGKTKTTTDKMKNLLNLQKFLYSNQDLIMDFQANVFGFILERNDIRERFGSWITRY